LAAESALTATSSAAATVELAGRLLQLREV
jgi:hypothetical protein